MSTLEEQLVTEVENTLNWLRPIELRDSLSTDPFVRSDLKVIRDCIEQLDTIFDQLTIESVSSEEVVSFKDQFDQISNILSKLDLGEFCLEDERDQIPHQIEEKANDSPKVNIPKLNLSKEHLNQRIREAEAPESKSVPSNQHAVKKNYPNLKVQLIGIKGTSKEISSEEMNNDSFTLTPRSLRD